MSFKSLRNEVTCSLCVKYFIDLVTLGCGHSFCMPCLCLYWEEGQWPPRCPVCRETPHQLSLKANIILKTRVFLARRTGPYGVPRPAEKMCELHGKTKNLFCEVTKEVLCLVCCMSVEHGAHMHCSVEWTAEEYRDLKNFNINLSDTHTVGSFAAKASEDNESYVTMWKKMNQTQYWKMFYLVYYGEKHRLEKIEEESKEIFQQLKESQYNMDLKQKLLRQIYEELKELCCQSDMELIQCYKNMWKRKVLRNFSSEHHLVSTQTPSPRKRERESKSSIQGKKKFQTQTFYSNNLDIPAAPSLGRNDYQQPCHCHR
ncbi:hypothetical protein E5288_WYG012455 [Bos mutus]|uniref:RING-type domain-containing protein n=1 Tax=Bos mutus TaxID=72004 RepID=A0A6B0SD55_9CETA|nr:hypothetical protein [Bos mutus]